MINIIQNINSGRGSPKGSRHIFPFPGIDRSIDSYIRDGRECTLEMCDPKIAEIVNRYTEHPERCESLRVVHYKKGGLYKPHQDGSEDYKNNRVHTFIFALNDDYEGGETIFPNLKKIFKSSHGLRCQTNFRDQNNC